MIRIIDLPIEDVWPIIFRYLSINDLFNCRLVNKLFKYYSDHTNGINKLIVGQPHLEYDDNYWHYNYKLIDDKEIISLECFRSIKLLSIFNLDKNLKYLKIYDQELELEEISNLINLESLEFGLRYYGSKFKQTINLTKLKIFISNNFSIQLNTPKLEKIKFEFASDIRFKSDLESIKHLITMRYDNELIIFKNLEIMELRNIKETINGNLLIIFNYLKQLKINLNFSWLNYSNEMIGNSLNQILNDKTKLRKEINIYLEGVRIENIDKFNEIINIDRHSFWKFKLNNYDLLDLNLSFIDYLYYGHLENCVNLIKNDFPSFFDKFYHINQVNVYSVKDVDSLNWFLNNLINLRKLSISPNKSLGQVFYNNLPNTIKYLIIYNEEDINYDFILKLSKLIKFDTNSYKNSFDLAFESFSNLEHLKNFTFFFEKKRIEIIKKDKKFYLNENLISDFNELVEECNKIRSRLNE